MSIYSCRIVSEGRDVDNEWLGVLDDLIPGRGQRFVDNWGSDGTFLMVAERLDQKIVQSFLEADLDIHGLRSSSAVEANV
jgi:hypothetical protein